MTVHLVARHTFIQRKLVQYRFHKNDVCEIQDTLAKNEDWDNEPFGISGINRITAERKVTNVTRKCYTHPNGLTIVSSRTSTNEKHSIHGHDVVCKISPQFRYTLANIMQMTSNMLVALIV